MVRCFFLLIHFLVLEDYFFFYFNCFPDDVQCNIARTDDNALNSSCDKQSDLPLQLVIWS